MPTPTATGVRDALIFHAAFFIVAIPVALTLRGPSLGMALMGLAAAYNLLLPALGYVRGHNHWLSLWLFLVPVSMALPCADWMLVERMRTLQFPDYGAPRLGGVVPVYFMGLWIMLLWPVCWLALATRRPYPVAAILALGGFLVWEWAARPLGLWHAVDVKMIAGFALYPLIPEVLLTIAALWMWNTVSRRDVFTQLAAALSVPVFYAGALSLSLTWMG